MSSVVIVRDIDHPWPDEGLVDDDFLLDPGTGLGERLRDFPGLPWLAVNEATHLFLQLSVAHDVGFAHKQRQFRGQRVAPVDKPLHRVREIFEVQRRLSRPKIAGIDMAFDVGLVDPGDLIGEKSIVAEVVIEAGGPQVDNGNPAPPFMQQALGLDL